jgi:uroporphyrinogen-III decarboxylase
MTSFDRTIDFIEGRAVDRIPFHPILMRFAARYAGVRYRDFCLSASHKCSANIKCATDFQSDWVNTMSDPYAEAEAFGTVIHYPDNDLPIVQNYAIRDISDIDRLAVIRTSDNRRMQERVHEITEYRVKSTDSFFVCGWVEGPLAEYCDIRDINLAMTDLYEHTERVHRALDIITESAAAFITGQVRAGAHCIGIGDSVCSLISPDLYNEFCFARQKALVEHIHSLGAYSKIHICGNISAILPDVIRTGANIIDIDHRTGSVADVMTLLRPGQVFSGKSDPVSVIQEGDKKLIMESTFSFFEEAGRRTIVSAGCEITPETSVENLMILSSLSGKLKQFN